MGGEDREPDPLPGQDLEGFQVHGGLREPEALRRPPEAVREVLDPPAHLRFLVPGVGQGKDDVVVPLRQGGAVSGEPLAAFPVAFEDGVVHRGGFLLHPGQQRRAEVEADAGVVVDDLLDPSVPGVGPGKGVGRVTFRGDPLVPVVVGICGVLQFDRLQPGVLPRRLVEMTVDTDVTRRCLFHGCLPGVAA